MIRAVLIGLLLAAASGLRAQTFTSAGMLAGSGLVALPSPLTTPAAQFRLHASRLEYLRGGSGGLNLMALTTGLSPNLEAYVRLASEQAAPGASVIAPGFGGVFTLPFPVPVAGMVGLWAETQQPDREDRTLFMASRATRAGLVVMPLGNGVRPAFTGGVVLTSGTRSAFGGASLTVGLDPAWQAGIEASYGYFGGADGTATATLQTRVFPTVILQASGGVLAGEGVVLPVVSLGVSFTTADVDFLPAPASSGPEFRLPSIEEMEREDADTDAPEEERQ
jgi:hypothetical protein